MHYKNGREAQVGDRVVTKDYNGLPFAGVVVNTIPGTSTCNLHVVPVGLNLHTYTAGECLHIEDAMNPAKVKEGLAPHQQRVVAEKEQLDDRILKLDKFICGSPQHDALPEDEKERMCRQLSCMREYSGILGERIAAFPTPAA